MKVLFPAMTFSWCLQSTILAGKPLDLRYVKRCQLCSNHTVWLQSTEIWHRLQTLMREMDTHMHIMNWNDRQKIVGPLPLVLGPVSPGNQQSLVLIASWSSLIGCHRSCRPRTNKKGPTILCLTFALMSQNFDIVPWWSSHYLQKACGETSSRTFISEPDRSRGAQSRYNCALSALGGAVSA